MEQFDSCSPVNQSQLTKRLIKLGFIGPEQQFEHVLDAIDIVYKILIDFTNQNQIIDPLEYFAIKIFHRRSSKSATFKECTSIFYTLESGKSLEGSILMWLMNSGNIESCKFYIESKEQIASHIKINQQLDDVYLRFNDFIEIARQQFPECTVTEIIEVFQLHYNEPIQPAMTQLYHYIRIKASKYLKLALQVWLSAQQLGDLHTPVKQDRQPRSNFCFQGFYKWKSPLFRRKEFLKNPKNQKMLANLKAYAQKHPQMQYNPKTEYLSPLKNKDYDSSKNITVAEILRATKSYNSPENIKEYLSTSFQVTSSFKKDDLMSQAGCVYTHNIHNNQMLHAFASSYNLEYFDPNLELPRPLDDLITYDQMIELYECLHKIKKFALKQYYGISYIKSFDPRYLQVTKNARIEAISQFEGWILAKNELGQIGCCSDTYIQRL